MVAAVSTVSMAVPEPMDEKAGEEEEEEKDKIGIHFKPISYSVFEDTEAALCCSPPSKWFKAP
jgi:hypothetical protein